MTDPYQATIKGLIEKQGPLGVNALAKALEIPLSTMQKHMHRQSYFKINQARKWDLPDNVVANDIQSSFSNLDTVIDSQLTGITSLSEMLITQIRSTITLLSTQKTTFAPVADKSDKVSDVHPLFIKTDKNVKDTYDLFKKYVKVCPEEYQDLLKNLDLVRITAELGTIYVNGGFNDEISSLFLEKSDKLSDDLVDILSEYQKES